MSRTIEIFVSPGGDTRLETKGFAGPACQQASRALEDALGCRAGEERTAEFYSESNAAEFVTQKHHQ